MGESVVQLKERVPVICINNLLTDIHVKENRTVKLFLREGEKFVHKSGCPFQAGCSNSKVQTSVY